VRPPQRARETLYSYLSRLRQALAAAGVAILGHSAAYSVEVDPAAVDMHRFTQLVAAARAADDEAAWPLFTPRRSGCGTGYPSPIWTPRG